MMTPFEPMKDRCHRLVRPVRWARYGLTGVLLICQSLFAAGDDALRTLIGEDVLQQNVVATHERAAKMSAELRREYLRKWVLPTGDRPTFRFTGCFLSQTKRADPQAGRICSPVLDLVAVAEEQGTLESLRATVEETSTSDDLSERQRAALLFLIDFAAADDPATTESLERFVELARKAKSAPIEQRWPMLLVLSRAVTRPEFNLLTMELVLNFESGRLPTFGAAQRDTFVEHVFWLDRLRRFCETHGGNAADFASSFDDNWIPIELRTAKTSGDGRPQSHWQRTGNGVKKLAGHNADYLMHRSPLRGDYQVECDISTGAWLNGSLMVAGTHLRPGPNSTVALSNFRQSNTELLLSKPLSPIKDWIRYRTVVKDQQLTVFLNGRAVYERELPPEYDPWVALQAWNRSRCEVKNLRITGDPSIPDVIELIADENLHSWAPYFVENFSDDSWHAEATNEEIHIVSPRRTELAGTMSERLLRYQRPMSEDGTIEYEFFYQAAKAHVHPALGRRCFILAADGVKTHTLTDGNAERLPRSPENGLCPSAGSGTLSNSRIVVPGSCLRENAWNRLQLQLQGDTVRLKLNQQLVYEGLAPGANRAFGLFHFADKTEAGVCNVEWKGNWPKQLLPPDEQDLRSPFFDELDARAAELPAVFEHDFRTGKALEYLDMIGDESLALQQPAGLLLSRPDRDSGVRNSNLTFGVKGDFDLEVTFRDLVITNEEGKKTGIGLRVRFEGPTRDFYAGYRRVEKTDTQEIIRFARRSWRSDGKKTFFETGKQAEESNAGRLRITRRGNVLSSLFAQQDSPNFRLMDSREVTAESTRRNGIELVMWCEGNSSVQLVLEKLSLRAEEFIGMPLGAEETKEIVEALDAQRQALHPEVVDFSNPQTVTNRMFGNLPPVEGTLFEEGGLRVTAENDGSNSQLDQLSIFSLSGCLDVDASFEIHQIDAHETGMYHSKVALVATIDSDWLRGVSFTLIQLKDGTQEVVAQGTEVVNTGKTEQRQYRSVPTKSASRLRLVIHDESLYFLYMEVDSAEFKVLTELPLKSPITLTRVYQRVGAIGDGRKVDVTWKKLSTYFSREPISPLPTANPDF